MDQAPRVAGTLATTLWRGLRHPILALLLALLAGVLVAAGSLLPQLPGQLRDEPATAARWLLSASSAQGTWGSLWLGLGLFDVLHSPLTALLGMLLALALSAHLAAQVASLRLVRAAARAGAAQTPHAGEPVPLGGGAALHRNRFTVNSPQTQTAEQVLPYLEQRFGAVTQAAVDLPTAPLLRDMEDALATGDVHDDLDDTVQEGRYVALSGQLALWLRLLLPLGLLLTLGAVWYAIAFGWQVTTPPLAPGDTFRAVNQNLELTYQTPTAGQGEASSTLIVRHGAESAAFSALRAQRARVGSTSVNIQPHYPGVLVQMEDGEAALARPGGSERVAQVGVVIPTRGGEESVLLPSLGAGLRIVQRGTEDDAFLLELYRSNAVEPVFRAELTRSGRVTIPLDGTSTAIVVNNMPGLQVDVRHEPRLWLAWVGLAVAFVGLMGTLRRAGFVMVQLAPWPATRTVVVIQSNLPREHARLLDFLELSDGQST